MHKWARVAVLVLALWLVGVTLWAVRPWSDTQPLDTPTKVDPQYVTYRCGAVFGGDSSGDRQGDKAPAYPLTRNPCRDRTQRRVLGFADLVLGAGAVVGVVVMGRRREDDDDVATAASEATAPQ